MNNRYQEERLYTDTKTTENTVYSTGAQRDNREDKLRMSLLPHEPLRRVLKRYLDGSIKYGENNWVKGMPSSAYYDSIQRHLTEWWSGNEDEDHLAAAAWNILSLMHTLKERGDTLDDRCKFPRVTVNRRDPHE